MVQLTDLAGTTDVQPITAWLQNAAGPLSSLVRCLSLTAAVLGMWRVGCDLGWTQDFFVASGVWSHWQVWMALAAALNVVAGLILRAAQRIQTH